MSLNERIENRLKMILSMDKFDKKDKLSEAFKADLVKVFSSYFKLDGDLNIDIKVENNDYSINIFGKASDIYCYY